MHHGNGTEACVANTAPSNQQFQFRTPFSRGAQSFNVWRPWYDEADKQNILFASVQVPLLPVVPVFTSVRV